MPDPSRAAPRDGLGPAPPPSHSTARPPAPVPDPGEGEPHAPLQAPPRRPRPNGHRIPRHPRRSSRHHRRPPHDGLRHHDLGCNCRPNRQGDWRVEKGCSKGDLGQTLPLYVVVVSGLLFLGLAYFAFGQAAASRNSAQGAADAAALAAAHDAREQLGSVLLDDISERDSWERLLEGRDFDAAEACRAASLFAARNDAQADECSTSLVGLPSFTVRVRADDPMGDSVIPGTQGVTAAATATAALEPRCALEIAGVGESQGDDSEVEPVELTCEGEEVVVDPSSSEQLPRLDVLFSVRLVG